MRSEPFISKWTQNSSKSPEDSILLGLFSGVSPKYELSWGGIQRGLWQSWKINLELGKHFRDSTSFSNTSFVLESCFLPAPKLVFIHSVLITEHLHIMYNVPTQSGAKCKGCNDEQNGHLLSAWNFPLCCLALHCGKSSERKARPVPVNWMESVQAF